MPELDSRKFEIYRAAINIFMQQLTHGYDCLMEDAVSSALLGMQILEVRLDITQQEKKTL